MPYHLYISLSFAGLDTKPETLHWSFYVSLCDRFLAPGCSGGQQYTIYTSDGKGWTASHSQVGNPFSSPGLIGFIRIGAIPATNYPMLPSLLQADDGLLGALAASPTGLSDQIWMLRVLDRLLHHGLVRAPSILAIEWEAVQFGQVNSIGIMNGTIKPRVIDSTVCWL